MQDRNGGIAMGRHNRRIDSKTNEISDGQTDLSHLTVSEAEHKQLFADLCNDSNLIRKMHLLQWGLLAILLVSFFFAGPFGLSFLPLLIFRLSSIGGMFLFTWCIHSEKRKVLLQRAALVQDVSMIEPLLDYLSPYDSILTPLATEALTELLLNLKRSDAELLPDQIRARLRGLLKSPNPSLVLALIQAYQNIGDERDLPMVQALLNKRSLASELRQAVLECLPYLQSHANHHETRKSLLRSSQPTYPTPKELLRSAEDIANQRPETLMRSSQDREKA